MTVVTLERSIHTRGEGDTHDISAALRDAVEESGLQDGTVTVFVNGSTGGVTTIEFEPGVVADLKQAYERGVPKDIPYAHEQAWHDGNGHSHVRAAMLGPSLVVPFRAGKLLLGTWQQVVLIDFDNHSRQRKYTLTCMGTLTS